MTVRRHEWATLIILSLIAFAIQAEKTSAELSPAIETIAMLSGTLRDVDTFGAGIVFAQRDKVAYIATANHVVRSGAKEMVDISVRLKPYPDIALPARLLREHSPDLDLALLEVTLPDTGHKAIQFDFRVLAEAESNLTGSPVHPIGRANNRLWSRPTSPTKGFKRDGNLLLFESPFIVQGASGGGLVEDSGVLLGMVLNDNSSFGEALDIHAMIATIKKLGHPVDFSTVYTYGVAGEWNGNGFFQKIVLERKGDRVSGHIESRNPKYFGAIAEPKAQFTNAGIVSEQVNYEGLRADIEGEIQAKRLLLRVSGSWTRHVYISGGEDGMRNQRNQVEFSARFNGRVKADEIRFDYDFEYGAVVARHGNFLALRKKKPEVKGWQSILEEAIKAKQD